MNQLVDKLVRNGMDKCKRNGLDGDTLSLVRKSADYFRFVRSLSGLLLPLCSEIMDTITLTRPQSLSR